MVITILEAQVTVENAAALQRAFNQAITELDAVLVQTSLVRNAKNPDMWKIITVWESRQALETMRQSGETSRGVLIFREAGAEPVLSVFDVMAHAAA